MANHLLVPTPGDASPESDADQSGAAHFYDVSLRMKALVPLLTISVLSGCRWGTAPRADVYADAREAEVIVLADVRRGQDHDRLIAREVVKGSLRSEFRFRIGDEITPGVDGFFSSGPQDDRIDAALLFYKPSMGVLANFCVLSIQRGRILALKGPEADLPTFIAKIKGEASHSPVPTPGTTPPSDDAQGSGAAHL